MSIPLSISWSEGQLVILDQQKLPHEIEYVTLETLEDVFDAIFTLKVRGAPAIGIAAAYGLALSAVRHETEDLETFFHLVQKDAEYLGSSRPTAVNLVWALQRLASVVRNAGSVDAALQAHPVSEDSSIVVVTRSPEVDIRIIPSLLATPARYIGVMGSRNRWRATREQLVADGIPAERLEKLHVPIGIEINAQTLEEIAMQNGEIFEKAGGGELQYIPCLNARYDHVEFLTRLVEQHIGGWPESSPDWNASDAARELDKSRERALAMGAGS